MKSNPMHRFSISTTMASCGRLLLFRFQSPTLKSHPSVVSCIRHHSAKQQPQRQPKQNRFYSRLQSRVELENLGCKTRSDYPDGQLHGMNLDPDTLSALILYYAESGLIFQAHTLWDQLINSSFVPNIQFISKLFYAYGKLGHFDEIIQILHYVNSRNFNILPDVYSLAISCFGEGGQVELMEDTFKEMVSRGFRVGSVAGNAFLKFYSIYGSLEEMENAYGRVKRSRVLVEKEAIRAVAYAYIKEKKFYKLGQFLTDVGLGRKNVGNLLWNLLLLSYAANFKMKSLQREFLRMVEAGFCPDVTTFNIRSLAFSRMSLFWDLHLSIEHMKLEKVIPDMVTYGCFVDAYLDRRLGKNLGFVLSKMNLNDYPQVLTDPLVFEALGKGDFHSSSEAFMEFKTSRKWTYKDLILKYLKKNYRRNQIFWNY